ncbi:MAG: c-type heme family protein [Cytophagales bacterium]
MGHKYSQLALFSWVEQTEKNMMKASDFSYGILFAAITLHLSCNPGAPIDTKAVKEEIQSRKIRKVSASDIMTLALKTGEEIQAEVTRQHLSSILAAQGGIERCKLSSLPAVLEAKSRGIEVSRISQHPRENGRPLDSAELEVYAAFEYAARRQLKMIPSLEEINETTLRYWAPIIMKKACKSCHGTKGVHIALKTQKLLQERFPADQTFDFEEGALMGLWRIKIPKREIIKNL